MQTAKKFNFDFVLSELQKENSSIHKKYHYSHPIKTQNKSINLSLGRIFFNECLPEDYPLINEPVNQKRIDEIIKDLADKYPPEKVSKTVSYLQEKFYTIGTISPSTFTIDVFLPSNTWMKKKKDFEKVSANYSPLKFQKEAESLTKELVKEIEEKGYRLHNILKSGVKGNPVDDWKNLLVGKGYVLDIEGNLLGPITHGIVDGLSKQEYFDGIAEARRGFYYKASLTAIPGYLAHKLTMAAANITLSEKDCGTKAYFEILLTKQNISTLTGRFMLENDQLVETNQTNLAPYIGQKIKIRSPLFCMSKKNQICPICFGTLAQKLNTDRVGILAAGVINQVTLNELMKMRHKSSQVNAQEINFPKIIESSKTDLGIINELLKIEKTKIFAKVPLVTYIDLSEYHKSEIIETEKYYQLPGMLTLHTEENTEIYVDLPFEFQVKVFKPQEYTDVKNVLEFRYQPGDLIIEQNHLIDQTDPTVVRRLFDAGFKYLKTPDSLTEIISKRLPSLDLVYIETMVQNMFRSKANPQNNCRLVHYKDCDIYSQKQLPFLNSWVNSISFENVDKGIKKGLLTNQDIKYDPIEKIILEKFD